METKNGLFKDQVSNNPISKNNMHAESNKTNLSIDTGVEGVISIPISLYCN